MIYVQQQHMQVSEQKVQPGLLTQDNISGRYIGK